MKISKIISILDLIKEIHEYDYDIKFIDEDFLKNILNHACNEKYKHILEKVTKYHEDNSTKCSLCGKKLLAGMKVGTGILCTDCNSKENIRDLERVLVLYNLKEDKQ